ncbi:MAG: peroxidase family protein, partial [Pseudomonadota bacterium]
FSEVSTDPDVVDRLASIYDSVDDIDLWVGGLAEDPVNGSQLGELFHFIVADQFRRLRDGDRYWYRRVLDRDEREQIERRRLSDVIRDNTDIGSELADDVFRVSR